MTIDREQRRLAEKGDPKYILAIPRAILPKPSLCDEMTATKSCNEIIALRSVDLARYFPKHEKVSADRRFTSLCPYVGF